MIIFTKKIKRNTLFYVVFLFLIFVSFFITSCTSGIRIIGEERKILENLAAEYYFLGEGYLSQKNYKKAMECFDYAMRDDSLYQQAYYKKGYSAAMSKDWTVAENIYKDLLLQDSKNTNISISLAYIYSQQGKFAEANALYVAILQDNPFNKEVKENYIDILFSMENFEEASKEFESYKELFPDSTKKIDEYQKKIDNQKENKEKKEEKVAENLVKEESVEQ